MSTVPGPEVMKWATHVMGPNAEVATKTSLHGNVSPWLLNVVKDGRALTWC
jgi:hypothetical protein